MKKNFFLPDTDIFSRTACSLLLVLCALCLAPVAFAQNIGIGTTSPIFKLDVRNGSINTDSLYRIGGITVLSVRGSNTFTGTGAGFSNSSGFNNTANGRNALYVNTTGTNNTAFGESALRFNTAGSSNTATGGVALYLNSTGNYNTAHGYAALHLNSIGEYNAANGAEALQYNTTGSFNTANGGRALFSNTTGHDNTAVGTEALSYNTVGVFNTACGVVALQANRTGSYNTAIGTYALYGIINGTSNTAIGHRAGGIYEGFGNVLVGSYADVNSAGLTNAIAMGFGTTVAASHTARFGTSATVSYGGWAGWSNVSDGRFKKNLKENVPGIEFINKLRPVTYTLDATGLDAFYHKNDKNWDSSNAEGKAIRQNALLEKEKITYTGFIAQEVETAAKLLGFDFSGVDAAKNENDTYGLRYAEFVVPLVKAVQELSISNDELKRQSAEQKKQNEELQRRIEKLESLLSTKIK